MSKKFKGVKPFATIERFEEMSYEKYKSLSLSSQVIKEGLARPSQKYFVGRLTEELEKNYTKITPFTTHKHLLVYI